MIDQPATRLRRHRPGILGFLVVLLAAALLNVPAGAAAPHVRGFSVTPTVGGATIHFPRAARSVRGFKWQIKSSGNWSRSRFVSVRRRQVLVPNLVAGRTYRVRLMSLQNERRGIWSRSIPFTPLAPPVATPIPPVATPAPVLPPPQVFPVDGGIPSLVIETEGGLPVVSKDDYLDASYTLIGNADSTRDVAGTTEIKGRGNSTWTFPKKPFRLKLTTKQSLFGFPSSKHWVLLANYHDPSRIRNSITMHLGRQTSLAWTPRGHFVRLRLNGADLGLYELFEQVRVDPARIAIDELKATDTTGEAVTGGYQIERDGWTPGPDEVQFHSDSSIPFTFQNPEAPEPEQREYIDTYVQSVEDAIYDRTNYSDLIDVDSWIDWYIVCELVKFQDAGFSSVNYFKPRGGKLFMGPLWDFDQSMGSADWGSTTTDGWWVRDGFGNGSADNEYLHELFKDPAFAAKFRARWLELEPKLKSVFGFIDSLDHWLASDVNRDATIWPGSADFVTQVSFLKSWLQARFDWIDANLPSAG